MRHDGRIYELLSMTTLTAANAEELRAEALDLQDALFNNCDEYEVAEFDAYWLELEEFKERCSDFE